MIRALVILGLLSCIAFAARSFVPDGTSVTGSGGALAFGFLLLAALQTGRVFHALRLPHLTGFLLCGAIFGPEVFGLITREMLLDLTLVKKVAVGLIALTAGCELNFRNLRPQIKSIGGFSVVAMVAVAAALTGFFYLAFTLVDFTQGMSSHQRLAIAVLAANVLCAMSPAVVMGILSETRSAGPYSQLILAIVVLADLFIAVTFALSESLARGAFPVEGQPHSVFGALFVHLVGSMAVGAALGAVFALYIKRVKLRIGLFVFAVCFVVAEAGQAFHLDPLLVGLSAGLFLENISPIGGHRVIQETHSAAMPTFAVFFAVVGAEVHLHGFVHYAPFAVGAAIVRAVAMIAGGRFGGRLAGASAEMRERIPLGMLPQAGIAIAFASILPTAFPGMGWAAGLSTLLLGTIVVNELVGPVVFRAALARSGEIGAKGAEPPPSVTSIVPPPPPNPPSDELRAASQAR